MKPTRICILLLSSFIVCTMSGCITVNLNIEESVPETAHESMNVIEIEMSEEAAALTKEEGKNLGAAFFEEQPFEEIVLPEFYDSDPYEGMPKDENDKDLVFSNELEDIMYGKNHVYTLTPESGYERIVFYIHGGAYTFNLSAEHAGTCDKLATALNAKVYIPRYTLAPYGTYAEGYELLHRVYEDILNENKEVILMGDSAGGGLALGFAQDLAENHEIMPSKMILLSPWVDITMSNPDIKKYEKDDLVLSSYGLIECGKMWAGDLDVNNPKVSPINYENWDKLIPTMIIVGTSESFYPDDMLVAEKLSESGLDVTLVIGNGLFHAFTIYPYLPESDTCIKLISDFIN